jgi:hypothetical protein
MHYIRVLECQCCRRVTLNQIICIPMTGPLVNLAGSEVWKWRGKYAAGPYLRAATPHLMLWGIPKLLVGKPELSYKQLRNLLTRMRGGVACRAERDQVFV